MVLQNNKEATLRYIRNVISQNKSVEKRVWEFVQNGLRVKRCYIREYNGVGGCVYYKQFHETRVIIGIPNYHHSREVYAVIVYDNEWV